MERLSDWLQHEFEAKDFIAIAAFGVLAWQSLRSFMILPTDPVPTVSLPINSQFDKGILEPFVLRSAPIAVPSGIGRVSFENDYLVFQNYLGWSFVCTRVQRQNTIHAKFVWKDLMPSNSIPEVWVAYPWRIGRTAMINFRQGNVYQILTGFPDKLLCKVNCKEWVEMIVEADYETGTFTLHINNEVFSLEMRDEPIGQADFIQIQFSLNGLGRVAIREISVS